MQNISIKALVLLMTALGHTSNAFSMGHLPTRRASSSSCAKWKLLSTRWSTTTTSFLRATESSHASDFSDQEISKMDDLILSLSLVVQDAERRDKVAQTLGEKLLEPNGLGSSDRFVALFDERLNTIGNEIRTKAAAQAEAQKEEGAPASSESSSSKQLWALIDMMVQSKIIFKQARGDGLL